MAVFTRLGDVIGREPTEEEVRFWINATTEQRQAIVDQYARLREQGWIN